MDLKPPDPATPPIPEPGVDGDGGIPADGEGCGPFAPIDPSFVHFAESLSDLVWSARPDGYSDYYNRRFLAYLGRTLEEMRGWSWAELLHPDDAEGARRAWERASAAGGEYEVEFRLRRHDGAHRWHRSRGSAMRDEQGRVVRWFGTCTDIEDRKAAEREAREAREWLALQARVLESMVEGVCVADEAGTLIYTNPAEDRMFGYQPGELAGRHVTVLNDYPPEENARIVAGVIDRLRIEGSWAGEWRNRRKDGTTFWTLARITAIERGGERFWVCVQEDITERKRAEAALRENEERFRALMEQAPFSVQVFAPDGRILRVNPAWEALWGVTLDRVADYNLFDDPQLEARGLMPMIRRVFAGEALRLPTHRYDPEESVPGRTRHRDPVRWIETLAYPLKDAEGRVREVVIIHEDVTARRRAEEVVRESGAIVRAFFDNSPALAGVVELTDDGDIVHVSDSPMTCRFFGLEPGATAGRRASEMGAPPQVIARWREAYRRSEAGGPSRFEYEHAGPDGGRWLSVTVSPIGDGPAGRRRFCYVAEDVTERHRAEEEVRASEERLRLALGAGRMGTWDMDLRTGRVAWSDNMEAVHGLPPGGFDGTREGFRRLVHPEDRDRVMAAVARSIERLSDYEAEFRIVRPDGSVGWMLGQGRVLADEAGRPARMIGIGMDITERVRHAEALQEADRRKDEFLATLAHELRNPLAPIRNGLQILRLAGGDPRAMDEALALMDRQVSHMVRLIDDLLDVSRITRGKLHLRRERVELSSVIRAAVDTSRPLIDAAGHELTVTLPARPIVLDADPTRLSQVVSNLLNNAAKYTEPGGAIALVVERRSGEVVLGVRDNGVGIPPEMLPRVFDMFTQVDRSLEKSRGGLGIGLAIVKRLVEMHGGRIEARSEGPGRGSEFVVRLPVAPPAVPDERAGGEGPPALASHRRRILVVDDNVDGAGSLALMLEMMGHEVRTAHDGAEGVAAAEAYRPELIVLDIGMPRLNGYDACRLIRERPWGRDVVIVALTGWGQDDDRRRSRDAGFDHHLVKPVEPVDLERLLGTMAPRGGTPSARRDCP